MNRIRGAEHGSIGLRFEVEIRGLNLSLRGKFSAALIDKGIIRADGGVVYLVPNSHIVRKRERIGLRNVACLFSVPAALIVLHLNVTLLEDAFDFIAFEVDQ